MILLSPENPPSFCTLMPPAKAKQFSWTYTRKTLSLVRRTILRAARVLWKIIKVLKWKMPTPTHRPNSENTETRKLMPYGMMYPCWSREVRDFPPPKRSRDEKLTIPEMRTWQNYRKGISAAETVLNAISQRQTESCQSLAVIRMRLVMKAARNFSNSTRKCVIKQFSSKWEIQHSKARSEPVSSLQNFQEWIKNKENKWVFCHTI